MGTGNFELEAALFAIAAFCTLVSSAVLLYSKDGRSPANRYLVIFLIGMGVAMLMSFLIVSGLILKVPWLYRLPSPLYYLMFPSAYFYVRMIFNDETHLRKTDFLHGIPALLHFIELTPYHLSPLSNKIQHLQQDLANPLGTLLHSEGILPDYMHNLIRTSLGVIYAILILRIYWLYNKDRKIGVRYFSIFKKWILILGLMIFLFSLSIVITISFPDIASSKSKAAMVYLSMAITQIVSSLYLLLNPEIIFGMPRLERLIEKIHLIKENQLAQSDNKSGIHTGSGLHHDAVAPNTLFENSSNAQAIPEPTVLPEILPESDRNNNNLVNRDYDEYIGLLNSVMREKKPFLQKRYSINELATDIDIPMHHLSYILNNIFQIRYNDYINQWRLNYLKERIAKEDLSNLTMEGLAFEAGFSSRITFIRVVQKLTGMNPSDYFTSLKK